MPFLYIDCGVGALCRVAQLWQHSRQKLAAFEQTRFGNQVDVGLQKNSKLGST